MKAWIIREPDDGECAVVFNNHGLAARREGANAINREFDEVECDRAKQYDQYAELGYVPQKVRLADGWWFECLYCNSRVAEDLENEDDELIDIEQVIEVGRDMVYCNAKCQEAHTAQKAEINQRHQKYMEKLRTLYPDLTFYEKEGYFYLNKYPSYTCELFVDFPGMKHGPASLRVQDVRKDSQKPGWHCAFGDKEAFETWMSGRKDQSCK
jgi:hypothetical protein